MRSARPGRRELLAGLAAVAFGGTPSWSRAQPASGASVLRELDLALPGDARLARRARVLVPSHLEGDARHPVVVLLHGYARHRSELDATLAWRDEYGIAQAQARLLAPPLRFEHEPPRYLSAQRRAVLDAALAQQPFRGAILVCPVTPAPYFTHDTGALFDDYADWLDTVLLPAVRQRVPATARRAGTGLAGVSMGAHVALEVMLRRPAAFGAYSGLQIAIEEGRALAYADRLQDMSERAGARHLQIVTSVSDHYAKANSALHGGLERHGIVHTFLQPSGPHTATWVQEVGALELLHWQDAVLRRSLSPG